MVGPMLLGFILLATLEQFVSAAPPAPSSTASSPDTPDSPTPTLIATANLAGAFNVTGHFQFALQSGTGPVAVSLEVNGLNALNSTLQYSYHIHTNPISSDGNCTSALAHLDPLSVTEALICSPQMPKYCQEGDLAGRNGKLGALEPSTKASYIDNYLRFWPQPFSILGRSVVVHLPNSTRIACGNITSVVDGTENPDGSPTFRPSNYTTQYATRSPPAVAVKYTPFNGTTPNNTVLALITLPSPLPTVQELPNIILGTNTTTNRTSDGKAATLPAALNAISPFSYTPGAILPSQNDTSVVATNTNSSTLDSSNRNTSKKGASSSGVSTLTPSVVLTTFIGFCFVIFT